MTPMDKIKFTVGMAGIGMNVFNFSLCSQYDETGQLFCTVGILCGAVYILTTEPMRRLFAAAFHSLAESIEP